MAETATLPLTKAVLAALLADAGVKADTDPAPDGSAGVYLEGALPTGMDRTTSRHVVIGSVTETAFDTFQRRGHEPTLTLHVWEPRDQIRLLELYDHLKRVLDRTVLTLETGEGHVMVRGFLGLTTTARDPDGPLHLIASYRAITRRAV